MNYIALVWAILILFVRGSIQFQSFTAQNHILPYGRALRSFSTDWFGCVESCFQDFKCVSYNYWFFNESEKSEHIGVCELNQCGVSQRCEDGDSRLVFQNGAIFHQIRTSQVNYDQNVF